MQNRAEHQSDPLPIDKGWDLMAKQLDEAMPQRRRRFVWWLWLGAGLVFLGTAFGALQSPWWPVENGGDVKEQQQLESNAIAPVADLQLPTATDSEAVDQETVNKAAQVARELPTVNTTVSQEKVILANSVPPSDDVVVLEQESTSEPSASNTAAPDSEESQQQALIEVLRNATTQQFRIQASPASMLNTTLEPLSETTTDVDLVPTPVRPRRLHAFLETAIITPLNIDYPTSIALGGGLSRHLNDKWQLALAFQMEGSLGATISNLNSTDEVSGSALEIPYQAPYVRALTAEEANGNLSFVRLNLSFEGSYRLTRRLHLTGGVITSYMKQAYFRTTGSDAIAFGIDRNENGDGGAVLDIYGANGEFVLVNSVTDNSTGGYRPPTCI